MTSEQLDAKYSKLTGLRFKVSDLVAEAGNDAAKKKHTYEHLMWHIKNGLIRGVDGIKELVEEVIPALTEAFGQQSSVQPSEQAVYTAAEAAAYNATLQGAKTTSDWKVEPVEGVEGVEAQPAVYYTQEEADAYNTEHELESTDEGFVTTETIKTPAVEAVAAVAAVEGVHYTQEEADAYNATLQGAVKAGDPKPTV